MRLTLNRCWLALTAGAAIATSGCAWIAPGALPPGTPISQARESLGGPTGEYALPGGGTRLEFARGSFGKRTDMLDFDAAGRLVKSEQVLTEANFAKIVPGMSAEEVRMRLGRPAQVFYVPWQKLEVWNYRFYPGDCVWFQISVSQAAGRVTEAAMGTDPACDAPSSHD